MLGRVILTVVAITLTYIAFTHVKEKRNVKFVRVKAHNINDDPDVVSYEKFRARRLLDEKERQSVA